MLVVVGRVYTVRSVATCKELERVSRLWLVWVGLGCGGMGNEKCMLIWVMG